jgi:energy-coupling factor transport system ATP-binding protein
MPLTLSSIGYTYGPGTGFAVPAVRDVSFEVAVGELVLVLGATGSGKSTLLRLAAGLLEPQLGHAAIDGAPLDRRTARGSVGLVFQDAEAQLFADTLADDVAFGPRNMGHSADRAQALAREALASVGLDPQLFAERSPFSLSGGEARRAAIAGVLAMQPRYLLADEPTAGLDASGRSALRGLLLDARNHAGVVVVSHTAEEFLGEADRVLVLSDGQCAWYGAAAELVADPGVLATAGLCAPALLDVQVRAAARGLDVGAFTLDVQAVAASLAAARGRA